MNYVGYSRSIISVLERVINGECIDGYSYKDERLTIDVIAGVARINIQDDDFLMSVYEPIRINEREHYVTVHGKDWFVDIHLEKEAPQ